MSEDMTDRKRPEDAVRPSERCLSTLISHLSGYVYRVANDPHYTPEFISEGVFAITGYRQEEYLVDRTISGGQIIHPDDAEPLWNLVQQSVAAQQLYECEYRIITKSGDQKWVWERGQGIYSDQGDLICLEGFVTDITDRKRAEAALRQREEHYRQLAEDTPALICQFLPDSTLTYVNSIYCQYFNKRPEELLGCRFLDFLPEAERQAAQAHYMALTPDAPSALYEHSVVRPDGSEAWQQWINRAFFDQQGRITSIQSIGLDITDRKRAEARLQDREERLRLAVMAAKQGIYDLNVQTGVAIVSPEYATMLGYDPETFRETNAHWIEQLHPDDRERVGHIYQTYVAGKIPEYKVEFRQRTQAGDWKWILSLGKIVEWDATGQPLRMLGTHTDISDRKQAEAERLQAEKINQELKLLENILEITLAGYWDYDIASNEEYLSPGFKGMFGYADHELPSSPETWQRLIFPEDLPGLLNNLERHFQSHGEVPFYNEVRYRHRDGSTVWVMCSGAVIEWDREGRPARMVGCHIDITQRKQVEELLQKSDTHLKTAQRIGKLGSWEYEIQTGQLTWSEEVFRIYGLDPTMGPPTYEDLQRYIHPGDWEQFHQTVQVAVAAGQSYDLEHRLIQPSGAVVYVAARGEMIHDAAGRLTHIIGTALDITDRKLAEQKIQQTVHQLAATNQELESFSYSVSHDLRAPLRHINGFVSALRHQLESHQALTDPKVAHYLQVIETSSQKMALLIDGLLTLSRIGRKPMTYATVNLRELVNEAIALGQNSPETIVPVEFVIGALPTVQGDATLLQQVLSNLIGNAVKFSRHNAAPRIEIGSLPEGTIFVRDNGVGFQMEYADKLFGAFQRLHAQAAFEGTGIGLAIVQRIIHRHGGEIWAESQPNQGATFYFTIGGVS